MLCHAFAMPDSHEVLTCLGNRDESGGSIGTGRTSKATVS